jgi:hypothetical protein
MRRDPIVRVRQAHLLLGDVGKEGLQLTVQDIHPLAALPLDELVRQQIPPAAAAAHGVAGTNFALPLGHVVVGGGRGNFCSGALTFG